MKRVLAIALAAVIGVVVLVSSWAIHEGYLPPLTGYACTNDYDPRPYDELVADGRSPYCSRRMHDQNWW